MVFLPGTDDLLVARSNGEILLIPDSPPSSLTRSQVVDGVRPPASWMTLDSSPVRLTIDPSGAWLAAACEDGAVRVLSILDLSEKGRIAVPASVTSLAFTADGSVLMIRTADGTLALHDTETLDRLTRWTYPQPGSKGLAAWVGGRDTLLLSEAGGVFEHNFWAADPLIEENRTFGLERDLARRLAENQPFAAWQTAERIAKLDRQRGRAAQRDVIISMLQRPGRSIRPEWIQSVSEGGSGQDLLRLGHAAYSGGHYALARDLLTRAQTALSNVDAMTRWRLAQCEYVLDEPAKAAEGLRDLVDLPGLSPADAARTRMQLMAALYLADKPREAEAVLRGLDKLSSPQERAAATDQMAAVVVGSSLLGAQEQTQWAGTLQALLSQFREAWLPYRDDIEFFSGERARKAGDLNAARQHYQLCIDIANDPWPAPWARHRLKQLSD
jgi:hypothetical protein